MAYAGDRRKQLSDTTTKIYEQAEKTDKSVEELRAKIGELEGKLVTLTAGLESGQKETKRITDENNALKLDLKSLQDYQLKHSGECSVAGGGIAAGERSI